MSEELISIVLEVMISNEKPMTLEDIIEVCGFQKTEVIKSTNTLVDLNIINKYKNDSDSQKFYYQLVKELKGITIAQAAQLGIDICAFEYYFTINPEQKKIALELATQAEKIKDLIISKRKPLLQKRSYLNTEKSDDNLENLILLLEASNMAIYTYIEEQSLTNPYLKLLLDMHEQAESSLRNYSDSLK